MGASPNLTGPSIRAEHVAVFHYRSVDNTGLVVRYHYGPAAVRIALIVYASFRGPIFCLRCSLTHNPSFVVEVVVESTSTPTRCRVHVHVDVDVEGWGRLPGS